MIWIVAAMPFIAQLLYLLVCVKQTLSRSGYPKNYVLNRADSSALDDGAAKTLQSIDEKLRSLGFRTAGDYRIEFDLGGDEKGGQIDRLRFWLSADRRILAVFQHLTFLIRSGAGQIRTTWMLDLVSWSNGGAVAITTPYKDPIYRSGPGISRRALPSRLLDLETLIEAHQRHQAEFLKESAYLGEDDVAMKYGSSRNSEARQLCERGFFRDNGAAYSPGLKLALWIGIGTMNPFAQSASSTRITAIKLGAVSCVALAAAWFAPAGTQWIDPGMILGATWALIGLSLAWLTPNTVVASWLIVTAPAHVLSVLLGYNRGSPWIWALVSTFALGWVVESVRYSRASARRR